jgi:hypothetical protein
MASLAQAGATLAAVEPTGLFLVLLFMNLTRWLIKRSQVRFFAGLGVAGSGLVRLPAPPGAARGALARCSRRARTAPSL